MADDPRLELIRANIRDVPDFPKPGIVFKDITPLLAKPIVFRHCIDMLAERWDSEHIDVFVGIESRGFIFGAAISALTRKAFVPVRKPGKLPALTDRVEYALEYGTDSLEMHQGALVAGQRAVIIDDLIATGGTAAATMELIERQGAFVAGASFVIELGFLKGRSKLGDVDVHALVAY